MLDTVAHSSVGAAFGALAGRLISTLSVKQAAISITNFFISNRDPKTSGPDNTNSPEEIFTNTSTTNNQTPADNSKEVKEQQSTANASSQTIHEFPLNDSREVKKQSSENSEEEKTDFIETIKSFFRQFGEFLDTIGEVIKKM